MDDVARWVPDLEEANVEDRQLEPAAEKEMSRLVHNNPWERGNRNEFSESRDHASPISIAALLDGEPLVVLLGFDDLPRL